MHNEAFSLVSVGINYVFYSSEILVTYLLIIQ